jgi:cytochrome c oxidase subunit 1
VVHGREPLWEPPRTEADGAQPAFTHVGGLAADTRELLATTVLDARPDLRVNFPDPTIWPFVSAVAVTALFIGSIFTPWAVVWGSIPIAIALTAWFWPERAETSVHLSLERKP